MISFTCLKNVLTVNEIGLKLVRSTDSSESRNGRS